MWTWKYNCILCCGAALGFLSCSTTKHLPEGETLYTGVKQIVVEGNDGSGAAAHALEETEAALAYPPNNALFGSSSVRTPLPVGLWMYNALVNKKSKLGRWMFDKFAAKPVLLSTVNPGVRVAIARNVLRENGYFDGATSYELIPDAKNTRKAGVAYRIEMKGLYTYDSIRYVRTRSQADSLIQLHEGERLLRPGYPFRVATLEAERQRISSLLRGHGFYYHRPEYIVYQADTLQTPGKVSLRVSRKPGLPPSALTPYRIGKRAVWLHGFNNEQPTDSLRYKDMTVYYEGKLRLRPSVLYRRFMLHEGDFYSEDRQHQTQTALSNLAVFRYAEMQFTPRDTSRRNNILDLRVNTVYDLPLDGELEVHVTDKSNDLRGPGAIFSLTRRNLFRGGEIFRVQLNGSYEWQTGQGAQGLNSYEAGAGATLTLPFVLFPGFTQRGLVYPSNTTFRLHANALNRARFFRMLSFNAGLAYEFQPVPVHRHTFTPFRLTYNRLQSTTAEFDAIASLNPVLFMSLADQFIPAFSYTYTYDDSSAGKRHPIWWEASLSEAGNLLSGIYALAGERWNEEGKELFDIPFAQFIKATAEFRYNHRLDRNNRLVGRLMAGAIYSYGNARISPFSEQFYLGGANSLRAFTIRSIGPGRFRPLDPALNRYAYIDQTGDLKLEANLEYRFRILGDLHGATFLDAGGIWLMREDKNREGGTFALSRFWNDLALGAGAGLRYDLDFLVIRFDLGVGLHLPYDTGKSGYYNIPRFKDVIGYHLAVGYPF
ncbi:MAG: BamA/TamA family outer membrane protein [Tannerellaceae bacterium]|jgi:outer membrane translocation and assembly module TamA|nr:BamA/TamA family outer membrane protein [Tannerellaceae bacterium]